MLCTQVKTKEIEFQNAAWHLSLKFPVEAETELSKMLVKIYMKD